MNRPLPEHARALSIRANRATVRGALAVAVVLALALLPSVVFAQSTTGGGCNTGAYTTAFNGISSALNATLQFFYGPFFKIGCAIAFIVSGVMLFLRGDELNQVVTWILRGVMVVAVIAGIVTWILSQANGSSTGCVSSIDTPHVAVARAA